MREAITPGLYRPNRSSQESSRRTRPDQTGYFEKNLSSFPAKYDKFTVDYDRDNGSEDNFILTLWPNFAYCLPLPIKSNSLYKEVIP